MRPRAVRIAELLVLVGLTIAIVLLLVWPREIVTPRPTSAQRLALLERQIDTLKTQEATACPEAYGALAAQQNLHLSLFWGYGEFAGVIADDVFAQAMAAALELPCGGTMAACGFEQARADGNLIALQKKIEGRTVDVDVYWTSLTSDHAYNTGAGRAAQDERSRTTKEAFYRALHESDGVFFNGHSRRGGGVGFDPSTDLEIVIHKLTGVNERPILAALSTQPSRLKLLSVMSCNSDQYYEAPFRKAAPGVTLLLVKGDVSANQNDQVTLGVLNAILGRRCAPQLKASMRAVDIPDGAEVVYLEGRGA